MDPVRGRNPFKDPILKKNVGGGRGIRIRLEETILKEEIHRLGSAGSGSRKVVGPRERGGGSSRKIKGKYG